MDGANTEAKEHSTRLNTTQRKILQISGLNPEGKNWSPETIDQVVQESGEDCLEKLKEKLPLGQETAQAITDLENSRYDRVRVIELLRKSGLGRREIYEQVGVDEFTGKIDQSGKVVVYGPGTKFDRSLGMELRDLPAWLARTANFINQTVFEREKLPGIKLVILKNLERDFYHPGSETIFSSNKNKDRNGRIYHELFHRLADAYYGISNVPGLIEGAAVASANILLAGGSINSYDQLPHQLEFFEPVKLSQQIRASGAQAPESPTGILELATTTDEISSYELTYWYGAALYEAVTEIGLENNLSAKESNKLFWQLYEASCGTVRDPKTDRILAKDGKRQHPNI